MTGVPSLFACWFQPGLFNQPTMFFSQKNQHQPAQTSTNTNQRTGWHAVTQCEIKFIASFPLGFGKGLG